MIDRLMFLRKLNLHLDNEPVVTPLGKTSEEWFGIEDRSNNFYMLGSMGLPIPFGLGIAKPVKENVFVIEGDGSCLMNLGTLSTVSNQNVDNLKIIILDNESYSTTGGQPTSTAFNTSLDKIANACGLYAYVIHSEDDIKNGLCWLNSNGTKILIVKIKESLSEKLPHIEIKPLNIKNRFTRALEEYNYNI